MPCASRLVASSAGALALALACGTAPAAPERSDLVALLRASIDAPRTVSYVGQFETVRFSTNRAAATIVKIEHRAPGLTRRWYVAPESLYGDYIVTHGTATYVFDTKGEKVTVSHNPTIDNALAAAGDFGRVLQNYRPVDDGGGTIAERSTTSIVLVNKFTGERAVRVWLDRETHLVLKKEEYHGNGAVASQTHFEDIRYTNAIPDGIFSTDAPAGYAQRAGVDVVMPSSDIERVIKDANFHVIEPKNLPQGFTVASGDVTTVSGVRTLHLLYTDGLRSISLFENATGGAAEFGALRPKAIEFDKHQGQFVEDGPTTLLTWHESGLYFALVGDITRAELVDIATSVVP